MSDANVADPAVVRLSISLVCFQSDAALVLRTLNSLRQSLAYARARLSLATKLTLVDNGDDATTLTRLLSESGLQHDTQLISNAFNRGFGGANNQVIMGAASDFHLVLNPDVELAMDALHIALGYLLQNPQAVAITPACRNGSGKTEYLCKRYPGLLVLLLRGFAPARVQALFAGKLTHYECRDLLGAAQPVPVPLISGCFMLCRTATLQQVGGFDEAYFLYFEDFALSLELAKHGELVHVPACHIVHHGGKAARKGLQHIGYFLRSACHFYQRYGWRVW